MSAVPESFVKMLLVALNALKRGKGANLLASEADKLGLTVGQMKRVVAELAARVKMSPQKFESLSRVFYHGNIGTEGLPSSFGAKGGGLHLGTRQAAQERIAALKSLVTAGAAKAAGSSITAARIRPRARLLGSAQAPVSERKQNFYAKNPQVAERLRKRGFGGLLYRNTVEDPGSISAIVARREDLITYEEILAKAIKKFLPQLLEQV